MFRQAACLFLVAAFTIVLCAAQPCNAALLANGGFETPALATGTFITISPGAEPAGFAWTVAPGGNVDLGNLPVLPFIDYPAFEGLQAVDLNGTVRGKIFQDFATVPSQTYQVSFAYADNPVEGGVSTADVALLDVGTTSSLFIGSVAHSTSTNGPPANADWQIFTGNFTATGLLTRLTLASTSPSDSPSGGIIVDAVSVVAVPEPTALVLAALALLGLAACRRRK